MYLRRRGGVGGGWERLGCARGNNSSAIGGTADGRKHKSNNIEFPDQWATSRFNYFFFSSSYFLYPPLSPSVISSSPLPATKDQMSRWVLFVLYPFVNERRGASGSDGAHPLQEMGPVNSARGGEDATEPDVW